MFLRSVVLAFAAALSSVSSYGAAPSAVPHISGPARPTVIFESELGDGADVWRKVVLRLPAQVGTFRYDRPGYGGTAAAVTERDPCTIASELHGRLIRAGVQPPYILVGHSLGGQYAYAFARMYPDETAGVVLVDATPPGHWQAMQAEAPGMARILDIVKAASFSNTMRREFRAQDRCLDRLSITPMPFPVHALVKTRRDPIGGPELERIDKRLAQEWLRLTGAAQLEPIANAGHYIQRDQPGALAAIIQQILDKSAT